jgi:hypothetical protein
LLDSMCRSRKRGSASWMMRARSCGKRGWRVNLKLSCRCSDTISHYAPVLIAPLSIFQFVAPPSRKNSGGALRQNRQGRQRNVARARGRRPDGDFPAGVFDHPAGALSAGHRDAAGAGVSGGGIRVPLDRSHQQAALDLCLCRRLGARGLLPGRHSGWPDPGRTERSPAARGDTALRLHDEPRGAQQPVACHQQGSRPSYCCWWCSASWRS